MKEKRLIYRKCLVCGKRLRITVYEDGYYHDGHYFHKLKIPIEGTGKWKKIGVSKLLNKQVDVVKWTGNYKKLEYWECQSCYERGMYEEWLEQKIEQLYGKRCPDFEKGCYCCLAWEVYDAIVKARKGKL